MQSKPDKVEISLFRRLTLTSSLMRSVESAEAQIFTQNIGVDFVVGNSGQCDGCNRFLKLKLNFIQFKNKALPWKRADNRISRRMQPK